MAAKRKPPARKPAPKKPVRKAPVVSLPRPPMDSTAQLVAEVRAYLALMLDAQRRLRMLGLETVWMVSNDSKLALRFEVSAHSAAMVTETEVEH